MNQATTLTAAPRSSTPHPKATFPVIAAPNRPLLCTLLREAAEQGIDHAALATKLGVQENYLRQLQDGTRLAEHIGRDFTEACARFLETPPALVLLLAGRIQMSDFVQPHRRDGDIKRALRALAGDEYFGPLVPTELATAPDALKRLVVHLYEAATQSDLTGFRAMPEQMHRLLLAGLLLEEAVEGPGCI